MMTVKRNACCGGLCPLPSLHCLPGALVDRMPLGRGKSSSSCAAFAVLASGGVRGLMRRGRLPLHFFSLLLLPFHLPTAALRRHSHPPPPVSASARPWLMDPRPP